MDLYTVTCDPADGWHIDPHLLHRAIQVTWPDARIDTEKSDSSILGWKTVMGAPAPDSRLPPFVFGSLLPDRCTIMIAGDIESIVTFVLWYRTAIPAQRRLVFEDVTPTWDFGETLPTWHVVLTAHTSKQHIYAAIKPTLSEHQWEVLQIIAANGKTILLRLLVDTLRTRHTMIPLETLLAQADATINTLWQHRLISSPATNWFTTIPNDISGILLANKIPHVTLSLTDIGERALIAKQHST